MSTVLFEAFRDLERAAELRMFGSFPDDVMAEWASDRVLFRGVVSGAKKLEELCSVDVLIVPSLFPDNSPLAIHEARAARIPVVGARIGGIPELVDEGRTGFLVSPGERDGLRDRMRWIVDHAGEVARLRGGISPVSEIDSHAREMEGVYASVMR